MRDVSWHALRRAAQLDIRRGVDLTVEGLDHLPTSGPVMLAARHYHHLHDGAAILATIPRPVRILVGLDWIQNQAAKWAMDRACASAGWPIVVRPPIDGATYDRDTLKVLTKARNDSLAILKKGEVLLIFPEGYPTIDPTYTPKTADDEMLPFQSGVVKLASLAARHGITVPIVPVGLEYRAGERWQLTMRFGEAVIVADRGDEAAALASLSTAVRSLSGL